MGRLSGSGIRLLVGLLIGLLVHVALVMALDLRDLPGPGGALLVTDLAEGAVREGLSSWLGWPLAALLGPVAGARALMGTSVLAALIGAALGGRALGGSGSVAALLAACWSLSAGQGWLISTSTVAWGLCWLGMGLTWDGARRDALVAVGLGGGLLLLAAAARPTALAAVPLVAVAVLLTERRGAFVGALLVGGLIALLPAWLTLPTDTPWLATQATETSAGRAGFWAMLSEQGRLPLAVGLGVLVAALSRSRPGGVAVALVVLGVTAVALSRGERLQPRHLAPLCFSLVAVGGLLAGRSRAAGAALVVLALSDSLAWSHAFAEQRAEHLGTAPAALPAPPWPTYPPPEWSVFFESSTPGALELMAHAAAASGGAVVLPLIDRRESHATAAAAVAGHPSIVLTPARCCRDADSAESCAERLVAALHASPAAAILPAQSRAVPESSRPLAEALLSELNPRRRRSAERWLVVTGSGTGPLPCASR